MSIVLNSDPTGFRVAATPAEEFVSIRSIGIDDWSQVRYVHSSAFETIVRSQVDAPIASAFLDDLNEPGYVDRLRSADLIGAWLDGELAGTAGWRPAGDDGRVAHIEGLFVRPLLTFMGIGSALLAHAEARALRAGRSTFAAVATSTSAHFFQRLGYEIVAREFSCSAMPIVHLRKREAATRVAREREHEVC